MDLFNEKAAPISHIGSGQVDTSNAPKVAERTRSYKAQAKWRRENPEKVWAHRAYQMALRMGLVERKPCELCGDPSTDFHHNPNQYDRPLSGQHLCRKHHKAEHKRLRCEVADG